MAPDQKKPTDDLESQVWNAISVFEQIVQAVPDDRVSLEALAHAYEQVGDHTRAKEYLVRLANVLADEGDRDAAGSLIDSLKRHSADPDAAKALARIEQLLASAVPGQGAASAAGDKHETVDTRNIESGRRQTAVAAELSFAWSLFQAGELTQEEYASVAQDLTEMSVGDTRVTVSVLHALHDRQSRNLERVIVHAAKDSGTPILPLSSFEVQEKAYSTLPLDFMVRNGVVPFEMLGQEALVAILNPYNTQLRKDIETMLKHKCHFYLTLPGEFDIAMEKIGKKAVEAAAKPSA